MESEQAANVRSLLPDSETISDMKQACFGEAGCKPSERIAEVSAATAYFIAHISAGDRAAASLAFASIGIEYLSPAELSFAHWLLDISDYPHLKPRLNDLFG